MIIIQNTRLNRGVPYLKSFISVLMDELQLSGKDVFTNANSVGFDFGRRVREKENNPNKRKKFLFDFRRQRLPQEFLMLLNQVQAQVGAPTDARPFIDNAEFEMAKCGFLIGFANAIFQRSTKETKKETNKA
jgi:hypothetical protein